MQALKTGSPKHAVLWAAGSATHEADDHAYMINIMSFELSPSYSEGDALQLSEDERHKAQLSEIFTTLEETIDSI